MTKTKRWGDSYFDRRDWKIYNKQLVKRGEFMLDLDFIVRWEEELYQMNLGKIGAQYQFPNSLIKVL